MRPNVTEFLNRPDFLQVKKKQSSKYHIQTFKLPCPETTYRTARHNYVRFEQPELSTRGDFQSLASEFPEKSLGSRVDQLKHHQEQLKDQLRSPLVQGEKLTLEGSNPIHQRERYPQ
jgi:hypothetical protein